MAKTQIPRAPIVERVAGWSARHRKTAVFGWLLLVVAALLIGQLASRVQWVFAFVLGLAFLLLCTTFRWVYIPALSIGLTCSRWAPPTV